MADPKAIILRRRARFLAASLAAAGIAASGTAHADDAGDASTDAAHPIDGGGDVQTEPQVCLCACALPGSGEAPGAVTAASAAAALLLARRTKRKKDSR
jgi:hypothetical protein